MNDDLVQSPGFRPGFQGFPDNTLYLTRRQVEVVRRESLYPDAAARLEQLQQSGRLLISGVRGLDYSGLVDRIHDAVGGVEEDA